MKILSILAKNYWKQKLDFWRSALFHKKLEFLVNILSMIVGKEVVFAVYKGLLTNQNINVCTWTSLKLAHRRPLTVSATIKSFPCWHCHIFFIQVFHTWIKWCFLYHILKMRWHCRESRHSKQLFKTIWLSLICNSAQINWREYTMTKYLHYHRLGIYILNQILAKLLSGS